MSVRVLPHNLEAEESLLGAMLLSRAAIAVAIETVTADDFYKPSHAHVFDAVLALHEAGVPIDVVLVAEELSRGGLLDALGGRTALLQLQVSTAASANAQHYARIVAEHSRWRKLIRLAGEVTEAAYEMREPAEALAALGSLRQIRAAVPTLGAVRGEDGQGS